MDKSKFSKNIYFFLPIVVLLNGPLAVLFVQEGIHHFYLETSSCTFFLLLFILAIEFTSFTPAEARPLKKYYMKQSKLSVLAQIYTSTYLDRDKRFHLDCSSSYNVKGSDWPLNSIEVTIINFAARGVPKLWH